MYERAYKGRLQVWWDGPKLTRRPTQATYATLKPAIALISTRIPRPRARRPGLQAGCSRIVSLLGKRDAIAGSGP